MRAKGLRAHSVSVFITSSMAVYIYEISNTVGKWGGWNPNGLGYLNHGAMRGGWAHKRNKRGGGGPKLCALIFLETDSIYPFYPLCLSFHLSFRS